MAGVNHIYTLNRYQNVRFLFSSGTMPEGRTFTGFKVYW